MNDSPGPHPPSRAPRRVFRQSAVFPFRRRDGHVEFLAVSNRRGTRWVIPKGLVEAPLSPADSAGKEAYEEAGVAGRIVPEMLGRYEYGKWTGVCRVEVFLLSVETIHETWPEAEWRERRWFDYRAACDALDERLPRALIRAARERIEELGGSA